MYANVDDPRVLNVFTDASLRRISNTETWVGSGTIIVNNNTIIKEDFRVYKNQTSNYAELKAIKLGIDLAHDICRQNPSIMIINLFSDSQISIFGIRDRIFNWRIINNEMVGYGNKVIANQDIILEIVQLVLRSNIFIRFFHQKGHTDQCNLYKAKKAFIISNRCVGANELNVDFDFIKFINRYNQMVDNSSRKILYQQESINNIITPMTFCIQNSQHQIIMEKYKNQINGIYGGYLNDN